MLNKEKMRESLEERFKTLESFKENPFSYNSCRIKQINEFLTLKLLDDDYYFYDYLSSALKEIIEKDLKTEIRIGQGWSNRITCYFDEYDFKLTLKFMNEEMVEIEYGQLVDFEEILNRNNNQVDYYKKNVEILREIKKYANMSFVNRLKNISNFEKAVSGIDEHVANDLKFKKSMIARKHLLFHSNNVNSFMIKKIEDLISFIDKKEKIIEKTKTYEKKDISNERRIIDYLISQYKKTNKDVTEKIVPAYIY